MSYLLRLGIKDGITRFHLLFVLTKSEKYRIIYYNKYIIHTMKDFKKSIFKFYIILYISCENIIFGIRDINLKHKNYGCGGCKYYGRKNQNDKL